MLSAQYLVNCLEEVHVCHGITTQERSPRPMKETLHSRHHSTVLPRLDSSRMESHQNLHTHAVDLDPRKQQSTEGASNIGRGAETEPKTTACYSISFDECMNRLSQNEQMDFIIGYWEGNTNKVAVR